MDELEDCPFCGRQPYVIEDNSYGSCMVGCYCEVRPEADRPIGELEEAIKAWNTRT